MLARHLVKNNSYLRIDCYEDMYMLARHLVKNKSYLRNDQPVQTAHLSSGEFITHAL